MKRLLAAMTAALMMAALVSSVATARPLFTQATGSVGLSAPTQFASFNAFDYGETGDRGTVNYTNWTYPAPTSGVWDVSNLTQITFWLGGVPYVHTVSLTVTPISVTSSTFIGTGTDVLSNPTTITGTQSGSTITFVITGTTFVITGSGTIAAGGSMSGNASATEGSVITAFTWTALAGSALEVFSYTAPVWCAATVDDHTMAFEFTIPDGFAISGLDVAVVVHDGGTPGTNGDTWKHGVAGTGTCGSDGATGNYPIVSGNLVVH